MVFFRDFPKADYRVVRTEDGIEVHTKRIHLIYNEKEFTSWGLSIQGKRKLKRLPQYLALLEKRSMI